MLLLFEFYHELQHVQLVKGNWSDESYRRNKEALAHSVSIRSIYIGPFIIFNGINDRSNSSLYDPNFIRCAIQNRSAVLLSSLAGFAFDR